MCGDEKVFAKVSPSVLESMERTSSQSKIVSVSKQADNNDEGCCCLF